MPANAQGKHQRPSASRVEIVRTVKTPLGFFVLVVLVVEAIFGVVAGLSSGPDRTWLVVGMLALIFLLVSIVTFMAVCRPESLRGARPEPIRIGATPPEVVHIKKPRILCVSSKQFEVLGFERDIETLQRAYGKSVRVEHELTSVRLRSLLTEQQFDILHLLSFVEPN